MNVNQFLPDIQTKGLTLGDLFNLRRDTFYGFCSVEGNNGGLDPSVSVALPRGQEQVRTLFARTVEEILESIDAQDPIHQQEEMVDAINFASSLVFLNYGYGADRHAAMILSTIQAVQVRLDSQPWGQPVGFRSLNLASDVGHVLTAWNPLLSSLRNRAWQNNAQSPYFLGIQHIAGAVASIWDLAACRFQSADKLFAMYVAKDQVLQFRLRTKY